MIAPRPSPAGPPYGNAGDLEPAKVGFRDAWLRFKGAAGPEQLAQAMKTQDNANSKGRK